MWALAAALFVRARDGRAEGCDDAVSRWAARCPSLASQCVRADACVPGRVVLSLGCDGAARDAIELTDGPAGFARAGRAFAAPVGEYGDFSLAPAHTRDALARVTACADALGDRPRYDDTQRDARLRGASASRPWALAAWRLWAAALCALLLAWLSLAGPHPVATPRTRLRASLAHAAVGALITVSSFALRRAVMGAGGFFHQNGQGPAWVAAAVARDGALSVYGPGQWEIFHGVTALAPRDPDGALFTAASALASLALAAVYFCARAVGATRVLAALLSASFAVLPIALRVAASESYYGSCASLLALAGALLVAGARAPDLSGASLRLAVATVGASLLVAQAARVHPVAWIPAACVSLVLLAGTMRGRAMRAAWVLVGLGALVSIETGPEALSVLRGPLGQKWAPSLARLATSRAAQVTASISAALATLGAAAVLTYLSRRARRMRPERASIAPLALSLPDAKMPARTRDTTAAVALLGFVVALWFFTRPVRSEGGTYERPYVLLWALPLSCAVAGLAVRVRTAWLSAGVSLVALAALAATAREDLTRPTDARELDDARAWRAGLLPRAVVYYPARGRTHVRHLPLYGTGAPDDLRPEGRPLEGSRAPLASLGHDGRPVYYYESSLCSTREADALCDAMRSRLARATLLFTRAYPAHPSGSVSAYLRDPVRVRLLRLEPDEP